MDINTKVGNAVAAEFVNGSKAAADVKNEYASFLGSLTKPEAKRAFDDYVLAQSPSLAEEMGITAARAREVADAQGLKDATALSEVLRLRYFGTVETQTPFYEKYLGKSAVAEAKAKRTGALDWRLHPQKDGTVIAKLEISYTVSQRDSNGNNLCMLKTIATGSVTFGKDGNVTDFSRD